MPFMQKIVWTMTLVCLWSIHVARAEEGWIAKYQARVAATQANQPHWATPFITVAPRVEQGMRADFLRQNLPGGQRTWNLGNTKGLQLIPLPRTEIRFSPPPFITHSDPQLSDGFGDVAFRLKYRLYGSNEEHHNAIVSILLGASLPTGKNTNGSCCAILTPVMEVGKGYGKLALITSIGGSLPASNTVKLGRSVAWNNAIQYHTTRFLWVETEFNSTFFKGGKSDGKSQTFITPGVLLSRLPLTRNAAGKSGALVLTLGAAEQIALTQSATYNHSPIFTARVRF